MEEDSDEYQTIPMYISKNSLYIFNYNLESSVIDVKNKLRIEKCKFKPEHQEILLEISLPLNDPSYDVGKGEQIVINCDGNDLSNNNKDKYFNRNVMDIIKLKGNGIKSVKDNLAIGFLNRGELHICPLQGFIDIKPSFDYWDKTDKRSTANENNVNSDEEEQDAKQVTVKFARNENEKSKIAREKSFGYLSKKNAEEPWYNMEFIRSTADRIELEHEKLSCNKKYVEVSGYSVDSPEFLNIFIPEDEEETDTPVNTEIDSLQKIKKLNLVDQLKHYLKLASILSFDYLITLIGPSYKKEEILRTVQQVAVLVQGNWIIKSELIYPIDSTSKVSGISATHKIQARDYMLYQFTQQRTVVRKDICGVVKITSDEVHEILKQFAEPNNENRWELIFPSDEDFIKRYAEVTQRQYSWWEAKYKQLLISLGLNNSSGRQRRKSHRDSSLSSDDINNSPIRKKPSKKKLTKKEIKPKT